MKKILFFTLLITGTILAGFCQASTEVALNPTESLYIFPSEFDKLILDFTITVEGTDTIKTLTIANQGTARGDVEITKAVLWEDNGNGRFDGMGKDQEIADGYYYWQNDYWVWNNMDIQINTSKRFFVSIETAHSNYIPQQRSVQMAIQGFRDYNGNGFFDMGDTGIFMNSGNNGSAESLIADSHVIRVYTGDQSAPKVVITQPAEDYIITDQHNYTVEGVSRDQGPSEVAEMKVYYNNQLLGDAISTSPGFATWKYDLINLPFGNNYIAIQAKDGIGNTTTTQSIDIYVSETLANEPEEGGEPGQQPLYSSGDLIKSASGLSVYYYGADGKRYVFPNEKTYKTWYSDFSGVKEISDVELGGITIGGNVTYKPGVKMVKITTDPKVYAVSAGGVLRWVSTEAIAASLYGADWASKIDDIPDAFFINYTVGEPIISSSQYSHSEEQSETLTINQDLGL